MAEADEKGQTIKAYGFNPTTMQLGLWSTDPIWQAETPNGSLTDPKARYDWLRMDHLGMSMRDIEQFDSFATRKLLLKIKSDCWGKRCKAV